MNLEHISVTILAKNSEKHLREVLEPLQPFGEVLLYDTGSTDGTTDIAKTFSNVRVVEAPFEGFGPTHNRASLAAKHDWILSIDSDEVATAELLEELSSLKLDPSRVYAISRKNYYRGKWIRWCGWHPDYQVKLYHRGQTRYSDAPVHEAVICDGMKMVKLKHPVIHYPYETTEDFIHKMQSYSTLFAKQYQGKRRSSLGIAIGKGLYTFFKSFVLKRGFLGGPEGFIISWYNANTAYFKYLKLAEANNKIKNK